MFLSQNCSKKQKLIFVIVSTFRTSRTKSYFVSEALFVPESKLLNKQKLTFVIVSTFRTSCTESYFVSEVLYVPESKLLNFFCFYFQN